MRILHIAKFVSAVSGGMEQVTNSMATAAAALGHDVTVVGTAPDTMLLEALAPPFTELPLRSLGKVGPVSLTPGYLTALPELVRRADLVHLHMPNPIAEVSTLALLPRLRSVTSRSPVLMPIYHAGIMRWPRLARLWEGAVHRAVLSLSSQVIACAPEMIDCFAPLSRVRSKVWILPFSSTGPGGADEPAASPKREHVELLAIGRLVRYKGFDLLLQALASLPAAWHLTFVGTGPEAGALRDLAATLGIAAQITWRGETDEASKRQLLAACDILAAPSRINAECFGLSIAEAFAYGKAVVTTDLPTGVAFLARRGACGALAEAGSAESLRAALLSLIADPAMRSARGQANRQFWREQLAPDVFERRYGALLDLWQDKLENAPERLDQRLITDLAS